MSLCAFSRRKTCSASSLSSRSIFACLSGAYVFFLEDLVLVDVLGDLRVGFVGGFAAGRPVLVLELFEERLGVLALGSAVRLFLEPAEGRDEDAFAVARPAVLEALAAALGLACAFAEPAGACRGRSVNQPTALWRRTSAAIARKFTSN